MAIRPSEQHSFFLSRNVFCFVLFWGWQGEWEKGRTAFIPPLSIFECLL